MLKPPDDNGQARIDKRVAQFVMIRAEIKRIEEGHKQELKPYKLIKERLIGEMLEFLDSSGQQSAKTTEGTVYVSVKSNASCSDPDAFIDFVRDNDLYELMDRSANTKACMEYAQENGTLPPGVTVSSIRTVGVNTAGATKP